MVAATSLGSIPAERVGIGEPTGSLAAEDVATRLKRLRSMRMKAEA
jgi:hypothetical protein